MTLRNQTSIQIGRAPPLNRETPQAIEVDELSHRYTVDVAWLGLRASQIDRFDVPDVCMQPLTARDKKRGEGIMAHPWVAGRRDWLDEIQAQLDKDFKCELEAMALAPPRERGKGKLSFQNLSHFVEEAIVARDWLE